jgi:homoserine kinase type II
MRHQWEKRTNMLVPKPSKLYHILVARSRPLRVNREEVSEVLAYYDLARLKGYAQPATGHSRSRSLILQTGEGNKLLKRYKSTMSLEGIAYEHSVLGHLAARGFPAPRLVLNRDGQTRTEVRGRHYALFDFITGFRYTDFFISSRREKFFLEEAGRALARYHRIMDGFVPAGRKLDGFMPDGKSRWRGYEWYLMEFEKHESLLRERGGTEFERFFLHNMGRLKGALVDLGRRLEENGRHFPKVVVHGDYGPYNLFFNRDGLAAILDFECSHLDLRAEEVVCALQRFAGSQKGMDYGKAGIFLAAYQSHYPLAVEEVERMPDIFRFARLRGLATYLRDYFGPVGRLALRYARDAVWWVDWMEDNGEGFVWSVKRPGGRIRPDGRRPR